MELFDRERGSGAILRSMISYHKMGSLIVLLAPRLDSHHNGMIIFSKEAIGLDISYM